MTVQEHFPMENVKAVVIYWHEKNYLAMKMYNKLLARAGASCSAYSTITNWVRIFIRGEDIQDHTSGGGRLTDDRIDTLIATALEESPFHFVRSLSSISKILPTTVWWYLHFRGYVVQNLHIVPHIFFAAQKATRIESAIELEKVLCRAKHHGWRYFLTCDESWFYFTNYLDYIWIPEGAATSIRPRQTIGSPKRMLTIFWSSFGFPLVTILPKWEYFNARYFCQNILAEINRIRPAFTDEDVRRNIVLHFDNADPRTAPVSLDFVNLNRMRRASQPRCHRNGLSQTFIYSANSKLHW
jgi:hypothetical protein